MRNGFSIAELLIVMLIVAQIATFTIPKLLVSQQNGAYKAKAKEVASMISEAYENYKYSNTPTASTKGADLTPFMSYVRLQTTGEVDNMNGQTSIGCSSTTLCLVLHNGGTLRISSNSFSNTTTTNAIGFYFDPDGVYSGLTTGPSKSVHFSCITTAVSPREPL